MLTEEQARLILRAHGWTQRIRVIKGKKARHLYAWRRVEGKQQEKYVCPVKRLAEMTEGDLIARLMEIGRP